MPQDLQLDSVDFVTIGTVGPPGQRTFHLQARMDEVLVTLTIEKFQASAIADSIDQIIEQIASEFDVETPEADTSAWDLALLEPIQPRFRVGQIGMGYDADKDQIFLVAGELLPEEALEEPRTVRIGATRIQMTTLAEHTRHVVEQGRPICGNCGQPIDPDGHFCPRSNGHRKPVSWA